MSELLSRLQQLGDGEIDDLSIAHDASEEIVALRLRVAELEDRCTEQSTAVQGEPVGRVKTVGGYPDESEHTVEWLCKYKDLKDGDLLYTAQQPAEQQPDVTQLVEALRRSFPLLDDEGLDEDEHHCEWSIQQERKRLHTILAPYRKGGGK